MNRKDFQVMHDSNSEGMEFSTYRLKDMEYQCYGEWEQLRGDDVGPATWGEFSGAFLDFFFPQD